MAHASDLNKGNQPNEEMSCGGDFRTECARLVLAGAAQKKRRSGAALQNLAENRA